MAAMSSSTDRRSSGGSPDARPEAQVSSQSKTARAGQATPSFLDRLPTVSPRVFRVLTLISLVFLGLIVVTGGAVRVTGSGLGCPTWPQCGDGRWVPHTEYALHGAVEFGNRMISIVMGVFMLVTPLAALRLPDRRQRRDLVWLSFGLWAGFVGQAVLGGITVLTDLHPATVAAHFLLSMLLLVDGVALYRRSRQGPGPVTVSVRRELLWLSRVLVVVGAAVLVLGTVVTGTGPHSGDDEKAKRFGFDIVTVSQLHADGAMLVTGLALAMVFAVRVAKASREAVRWADVLLATIVAQAAVGFTQYFLGIPAGLVVVHLAGATAMWIATLRVWLAMSTRPSAMEAEVPEAMTRDAVTPRLPVTAG
ncbi:heme A synthase [Frankia sp. CNm7]|uniref:Heme A synthase n=1 Tax=Frankia nepalensis TaxID=1836974 RepID=A0A937RRI0_9ACTN|nr:COX15/CtaA family protein [Frankia nepalensis]MBL7499940.1 heme A synthase [Frankia nepalensis]MBL7514828.1 heme A synthase [Frankia nepalensis]MBL7518710.1 heme A synthase [Frankia nepalensis]MBL7633559.1 heme A synthase [Frankia nepalensis]